ncbi:MAG TPA: hypothetical protein VFD70_18655 [Anaerolineae bacterium]|nr:hypothetical protein [Anaerolineae bacterium]
MEYTERITENLALLGVVNPQSANNTTLSTGWIDASRCKRLAGLLMLGADTGCTVDFKIQSATSAGGANAADIPGKAITQLQATDANKQAWLEIKGEEIGALGPTRQWIRYQAVVGNGTSVLVSVAVMGEVLRFSPAADFDAATVAQIVA